MTDPASNTNQRLPPLTLPGEYPYVRMFQYRDGSWWRQDEYPGNEGYARGHISGTFYEHSPLGGHKSLTTGQKHEYVTQGASETVDQNQHNKIGGSTVDHVTSDHYAEHGSDRMHATGGDRIHAVGGIKFDHATHGTQQTSTGDHVSDHNDGNHHINVDGDYVRYTGGTKYDYVGGEYGIYLPTGNFDIKLDKGKYQIHCGSDIIIKSDTKITLQVGNSSIVITPTDINIIASQNLNLTSTSANVQINATSGNVNTQGIHTNIQGGGSPSIPSTFT